MTALAGVYSRIAGRPVPDAACAPLLEAISRRPEDERFVFRDGRVCLVKTDIGAFGAPAFQTDPSGTVSMLAGEPLFGTVYRSRDQELDLLHQGLDGGGRALLTSARGAFCAAHYRPADATLTLVVDKLGLRSIYLWEGEEYAVFATSLRVLEAHPLVPRRMDVRAVTEITAFGYALATRTPYADIAYLAPAEIVTIGPTGVSRSRYWRWDRISTSPRPEAELVREAYDRFVEAIARRQGKDTAGFVFLSGGLDSRCVTGALRDRDVRVYSVNFAPDGTQDHAFSTQFAAAAGAVHENFTKPDVSDPLNRWLETMYAWVRSPGRAAKAVSVERERLVWSGNGGSLGTGHVGMPRSSLALLRGGSLRAGVADFLSHEKVTVPHRLLRPEIRAGLAALPLEGAIEEIRGLECADPGRALYLFLMLNEQRRHLNGHFENVDVKRLEYHLPFFDSDFMAAILALPLDACLAHRFYLKWLRRFPTAVTAVPWQAYPGSEPCPLAIPGGVASQFTDGYLSSLADLTKRRLREQAAHLLRSRDFPDRLLSKRFLRAAVWLDRAGVRDYGYVIDAAKIYHEYWRHSGGRYVLPDGRTSS